MPVRPRELIRAFRGEVEGARRPQADTRSGAGYDIHAGVAAVLFARSSVVAEEMFSDISFDTSKGRFREIAETRFGETPRVDQRGTGHIVMERTGTDAGQLIAGTTIEIIVGGARRELLLIDTTEVADAEQKVTLAVRAADPRPAVDGHHGGKILDAVWDTSWRVTYVRVTGGLPAETNQEFRARKKQERIDNRVGYEDRIKLACKEAGAANVATFEDRFVRDDFGLSHCYVGDSSFESTPELIHACRIAVEEASVGGCDLWVGGMTRRRLDLTITLFLWEQLSGINIPRARAQVEQAVRSHFEGRENAFLYDSSAIGAAAQTAVPNSQTVTVVADPAPPEVATMFQQEPLPRYDIGSLFVSFAPYTG